ncbi:unnamed protein product [Rangifer tarandus platyrhynchus]|uniref:Uncharacterized protein n=2 Tax=Rangifer tarandus platyrhynchus TaxID=3082113 RepID=A0AC59ZI84_RANTA|nr:unnamed protein product [Rangifer tarandus platyrhynchus]
MPPMPLSCSTTFHGSPVPCSHPVLSRIYTLTLHPPFYSPSLKEQPSLPCLRFPTRFLPPDMLYFTYLVMDYQSPPAGCQLQEVCLWFVPCCEQYLVFSKRKCLLRLNVY